MITNDDDDDEEIRSIESSPSPSSLIHNNDTRHPGLVDCLEWGGLNGLLQGRDAVETHLLNSFHRCFATTTTTTMSTNNILRSTVSELVLLTGPAGVGKTTLALSLKNHVHDSNGFMISGKFEQLESNLQAATIQTYSAFTDAFNQYIGLVVNSDDDDTVRCVKEALEASMESTELQVLQEIIPELGRILPRQTPSLLEVTSTTLKGADAEDRLIEVLSHFFRTICSLMGRPIILFLDDLQWANQSQLNVLANFFVTSSSSCDESSSSSTTAAATTSYPRFLLLCTCRMNEVSEDHPLVSMLSDFKDQEIVVVTELEVRKLNAQEVLQVVSVLLHATDAENSQSLAELLFRRTDGNLLFLIELIKSLCEDQILVHDNDSIEGRWTWDMEKVTAAAGVGSISRLIEKKVRRLDEVAQELLRIASCLGSSFSVTALAYSGVVPPEEINDAMKTLETSGLVRFDSKCLIGHFVHDKMHQTVYELTPESVVEQLHLNIGRTMRRHMSNEILAENVLLVAHQLSLGVHLMDDPNEKRDVSELFLQAGQKAALSSSFVTAAAFLQLAISLLSRRHWRDQYKLCLQMYSLAAELEYYNGNLKRLDELVDAVIKHARSFDDTLVARFTRIYSLGSRGSMEEGLCESMDVLQSLGVKLPRKPGIMHIIVGLIRCKWMLRGKTDEYILDLPFMVDKKKQATMRLMLFSTVFAFYFSEMHLPLIAFRLIENSLRDGVSEMSCVGFGNLAMISAYQGNIDEAYRYGNLALQFFEKYDTREWHARVGLLVFGFVFPLKRPFRESVDPLYSAHRNSQVLGDIHFSMACNTAHFAVCYYSGYSISQVIKEARRCRSLCIKYGQHSVKSSMDLNLQLVLNLNGQSANPLVLTGEACDEVEAMRVAKETNPVNYAYIHFLKFQLAIYMDDFEAFKDLLERLRKLDSKTKFFPFMTAVLHFFEGLAYAMSPTSGDKSRARQRLAKLKIFAKHAPCNFLHKAYLIEAELAAHTGKLDEAKAKFDISIQLARQEGMIQDQALACERAGYAFQRHQRLNEAREYLANARSLYLEWGAHAKADQLGAHELLSRNETNPVY